jgi:hypothetical protein
MLFLLLQPDFQTIQSLQTDFHSVSFCNTPFQPRTGHFTDFIYVGHCVFELFNSFLRSKKWHSHRSISLSAKKLDITPSLKLSVLSSYFKVTGLDLEFRHLWKVYGDLTGHKTPLIIIDSMGIYSRRKSLFAKIRGRYRTVGFADVRAISLYLISNRQKRGVRIVERGVTRVSEPNVSLCEAFLIKLF